MTPVEFDWAIRTKNGNGTAQYKFQKEVEFEAARLIIKNIWNSAGRPLKPGFMFKDGKEIERFEWDKIEKTKPQSAEHLKNFFLRLGKRYNEKKGKPE
jgi:hypothetical protein